MVQLANASTEVLGVVLPLLSGGGGLATLALTTNNTWLAFSFTPDANDTITSVRTFVSAVAGSPTGNITCDIYSDLNGSPNVSLGSVTFAGVPATNSYNTFTGLSVAVSAGTLYWAVFKNTAGVPGSNNVTIRWMSYAGAQSQGLFGGGGRWGWNKNHSTDGTTWPNLVVASSIFGTVRVGYASGGFDGFLANNTGVAPCFAAQQHGGKFTLPLNIVPNAAGLILGFQSLTGAPAGNLQLNLWLGAGASPVLVGTTLAVPNSDIAFTTPANIFLPFPSPIPLVVGGTYRVTAQDTSGVDNSSNCINVMQFFGDADTNSLTLLPFDGTMQFTKTVNGGTTFTDTPGNFVSLGLLLVPRAEFAAVFVPAPLPPLIQQTVPLVFSWSTSRNIFGTWSA